LWLAARFNRQWQSLTGAAEAFSSVSADAVCFKPVVFFHRQCEQRIAKGALDRAERVLIALFLGGVLLLTNGFIKRSLELAERFKKGGESLVVNNACPRPKREIEKWRIDHAWQISPSSRVAAAGCQ
jgi:hypothetical protein